MARPCKSKPKIRSCTKEQPENNGPCFKRQAEPTARRSCEEVYLHVEETTENPPCISARPDRDNACFNPPVTIEPIPYKQAMKRRSTLLDAQGIPVQSEVRRQMGPIMSDVFFNCLDGESQQWLGLIPPLEGPEDLWIHPANRLKGRPCLTVVPEPKSLYLKAFTHETILDVGQRHVELLENKCRTEKEEALRQQALELEEECQQCLRTAVDKVRREGEDHLLQVTGTLMEHFDKCFKDVVENTTARLRKQCELRVQDERAKLAAYMLEQLEEAVQRRELELCCDFQYTLTGELNALAERFLRQIETERKIGIQVLRDTIQKYEQWLRELRLELETSALVDLCRAVLQERARCNEGMIQVEEMFRTRLQELFEVMVELKAKTLTLRGMSDERSRRIIRWRNKMRALVKEFQLFINFALKAMPAHAQYLLSIDKLLIKKFPEDTYLDPDEYERFQKCVTKKLTEKEELFDHPEEEECSTPVLLNSPEEEIECGDLCEDIDEELLCDKPRETFNYFRFRDRLGTEFSKSYQEVAKKEKEKKEKEEDELIYPHLVCPSLSYRSSEESIDKYNEFCLILQLVGEEEKPVVPTNDFLQQRKDAILKIVQSDPELAMIVLGCSDD